MKNLIGLLLGSAILLCAQSCEFVSYDEWNMPDYDGLFSWEELSPKAEWSNRYDHAGVAFDGKLWIFGGFDNGHLKGDSYMEDIWSSSDGITWTLVTDNAPWKGRRGHTVNVFNDGSGDALFLMGGFQVDEETGYRQYMNDVWKSSDGIDWIEVKALSDSYSDTPPVGWEPRFNHNCINVNLGGIEYLYLIGGAVMRKDYNPLYSMKYFDDIWRSTDAINWEQISTNDIGERSELAAFFDESEERFYIHGGIHTTLLETEDNDNHPIKDYYAMWYSDDGENWMADTSFALSRAGHTMFRYKDKNWFFPGKNTSYKKFHMAWSNIFHTYRNEGGEWILDSEGSAFNGRHSYATAILNDKVYIMGGETGDNGPNNDVWCGTIND